MDEIFLLNLHKTMVSSTSEPISFLSDAPHRSDPRILDPIATT
jgi:hypothetical protein